MAKKNTKTKVTEFIEKYPELKDNDNKLCSNIWAKEIEAKGIDIQKHPIKIFLQLYAEGKLTAAPSIKRMRAKLQEENTELRGEKYEKRKGKLQTKWKNKLGYETENQ
jgi:hypothetical protein